MTTSSSDILAAQCKMAGLPEGTKEFKFHPTRKWRFDLCWPELHLAVEVDGGAWVNGRHNRASGWLRDQEKLNEACVLGWRILHVTPRQVDRWEAFTLVERAIKGA